jgi:tRNA threonylcarbamoyladenosine biosynthesis protein TsaE
MFELLLKNENDTTVFSKRLAKLIKPGTCVALSGDLGAGKTTVSRAICEYFGVYDITSPTFTIVNEYESTPKIFHFDLYRLESYEALEEIGFYDYFDNKSILLIEWAQKFEKAIPPNSIWLELHYKDEMRIVKVSGVDYESFSY